MGGEESKEADDGQGEEDWVFDRVEMRHLQSLYEGGGAEAALSKASRNLPKLGRALMRPCDTVEAFLDQCGKLLLRKGKRQGVQALLEALQRIEADSDSRDVSMDEQFLLLLINFTSSVDGHDAIALARRMCAFAAFHTTGGGGTSSSAGTEPVGLLLGGSFIEIYLPYAAQLVADRFRMSLFDLVVEQGASGVEGTADRVGDNEDDKEPGSQRPYFRSPFYTFGADAVGADRGSTPPTPLVPATALLPLALFSLPLQGEKRLLYSTDTSGFDFVNVKEALMGYEGGTLLLMTLSPPTSAAVAAESDGDRGASTAQALGQKTVGFFAAADWHDQMDSYGGRVVHAASGSSAASFVFTLLPELRLSPHHCYQYLNTRTYDRTHYGLGLGGSVAGVTDSGAFQLFLPMSLDYCRAFGAECRIDALEIWACACGTDNGGGRGSVGEGIAAQQQYRQQQRKVQERARTVDRAAFFNNEFDREMFLGRTFAHKKGQEASSGD